MSERLSPGDDAPDFTLPDDQGGEVSLSDLRGRKVIVYFYPAAMTPGCTTQACDFSDNISTLRGEGYEVLGISPDEPGEAREVPREGRPDDHAALRRRPGRDDAWGAFGEKKLYGKTVEGVIRSTVVVDERGPGLPRLYNVKATGHVAKLRRDLGLA